MTRHRRRVAADRGAAGAVFGAANNYSGTFYVYRATSSGLAQRRRSSTCSAPTRPTSSTSAAGLFTNSGDAIDVSNPAAPYWVGRLPYTGPVAARDPMTLLMLTIARFARSRSVPRADVRLFSNQPAPGARTGAGSRQRRAQHNAYSNLVYAGGDAVAFFRRDYTSYRVEAAW